MMTSATSSSRPVWFWRIILVLTTTVTVATAVPLNLDCDPCIRRPDFVVEAIVHGTANDPYWQITRAAMEQAALDMNVQFRMKLYDKFDPLQQRDDILAAAASERRLDALIVTLPSPQVHDAIRQVVQAGIPVFGFNAGYNVFEELGVLGFVAQDEYRAGSIAAQEFLSLFSDEEEENTNNNTSNTSSSIRKIERALFINHEHGNQALVERFRGLNDTLLLSNPNTTVEELVIDPTDSNNLPSIVDQMLEGCPYDVILTAGTIPIPLLIETATRHGCYPEMKLASFDIVEDNLQRFLLQDHLHFCLSQQIHLQATWPLIMSVIYATTSKAIVLPLDTKTLLSGPIIINKQNLPSDTLTTCQADAFPVCPNNLAPSGRGGELAQCDCIDRNVIRIGGVLHGIVTDRFWDPVYESAEQAAKDMGVRLELERFTETDREILYNKMAAQIKTLCESGVDGIFVTIPDTPGMREAIQICQLLNIPVIAVNSDPRISEEVGVMQHVGQDEWRAGYLAGQRAVEAGVNEGYCLAQSGNSGSTARCVGFADAIKDMGEGYNGTVIFPPLDMDAGVTFYTEEAVGRDDDWEGVGLLIGASGLQLTLDLQEEHPGLRFGMFDLGKDPELTYSSLESGRLLFTADQQPYLQGNLAVYLLTYMAYTQERLLDNIILTGPSFITSRPTPAQQICETNLHAVCSIIPEEDMTYLSTGWIGVGSFFTALTVFTGLVCLVWLYLYRETSVVKASQPPFLVMLVVGAIVQSLAIIPMGIETDYRISKDPFTGNTTGTNPDIQRVDAACMAVPWLYGLGFVLMFSALFAKVWRVKLLFQAALEMRRRTVEYKDVMFVLASMLVVEVALLVSWQIVSPHKWEREVKEYSYEGYALESVGHCDSDSGWYFMAALVGFHILCLFYALILCWQAKHIPSVFADSNSVSLSVIMVFQISILAIPIAAMVQDETDVFYFVRACALFLQSFTVLCLIFVPKIYKSLTAQKNDKTSGTWNPRKSSVIGRSREFEISGMPKLSGMSGEFVHNSQRLSERISHPSAGTAEVAPLIALSPCCNAEIRSICSSCGTVVCVGQIEHSKENAPGTKHPERIQGNDRPEDTKEEAHPYGVSGSDSPNEDMNMNSVVETANLEEPVKEEEDEETPA